MNSTLGSVVPLAMFHLHGIVQAHKKVLPASFLTMLATTWEEAGAQKEEELLLLKRKSHRVVISEDDVNEYFTCQVPETGKIFPVFGGNLIHI